MLRALTFGGLIGIVALLSHTNSYAEPPAGYYASTQGLTGAALQAALHEIIDDHAGKSYNQAHMGVDLLDEDPANPDNVVLLYSGASVPKTTWPDYNREHVWPQSLGARRRPALSDMHHIFAVDQNVNSSRGNKYYDDCAVDCRSHAEAPDSKYDDDSWEVPDESKGDIARALFYMAVRYEGEDNEPDLVLTNDLPSDGCNCMGKLATLLQWHAADQVDEREQLRNDRTFLWQGNRNPFVDHPEWVAAIWGGPVDTPASPVPEGIAATGIDDDVMYAHFIDVGQGNSTLLEFSCGSILIDAGGQSDEATARLVTYLRNFFQSRPDLNRTIDLIIVTHNHVDHTRALREVVEAFTVKRVIENGQRGGYPEGDRDVIWLATNATTLGVTIRDVDDAEVTAIAARTGLRDPGIDPLACGGTDPDIRILSADISAASNPGWQQGDFENKNNHSIVVRLNFGESSFLFTGDLEEPAIETLVEYYRGNDMLDVDVYHVGHHGSHNGTTISLLQAATPEIAVISMGHYDDQQAFSAWQYGHPRKTTVDLLLDSVARQRITPKIVHIATGQHAFMSMAMEDAIYATGWDGTVRLRASSAGEFKITLAD